jgi:predicted metal-binding protein
MDKNTTNIIHLPKSVQSHQELIDDALALGCRQAKVIQTRSIVLGAWIRLKCQYGCAHFGRLFTCPPYSPTHDEAADILVDYKKALLIQGGSEQNLNEVGLALEGRLRQKGFHKAFAVHARPCDLCEECTIDTRCHYPEKARPTLQACGINLSETLSLNGWQDDARLTPCSETSSIGMVLID